MSRFILNLKKVKGHTKIIGSSAATRPGTEVIRFFSCSTQMSTEFQLLIKTKVPPIKKFLALSLSDVVFIMRTNVKMSTIVGILTFICRINFVLSLV